MDLVNFPTLVCAGDQTGPTSTCSSGVWPGPLVGCEYQIGRGQTVCTDCYSHAGLGPLAPVLVIKQDDQQHKFATGRLWEEPQGDGGDRKIRSQVTACHMKKATSTSPRKQFESRGKSSIPQLIHKYLSESVKTNNKGPLRPKTLKQQRCKEQWQTKQLCWWDANSLPQTGLRICSFAHFAQIK